MADNKPTEEMQIFEQKNSSESEVESSGKNAADFELTGLQLFIVIFGLALAIFHMSLDSSILATAIPRITSQFNSTSDIGWYGSAYSFAMCALQPTSGKLLASFNLKWTFISCIAVFELGSLLCALSINSPMLIIGRAIAGAGAAGCLTGAFCIVAVSLPLEKRPVYIGILQSTYGVAAIIGPILGGVFTEHATWRWCFWINLPIGALTIFILVFFFKPPTQDSTSRPPILERLEGLDMFGLILFAPAIIMILLAVQWGGTTYPWKSGTVIGLFVGGIGLGLVFALWQVYRGDRAMIPPRLVTERTMFFACSTEFFAMGAVFISIYYLPEWFQVIKGASPTKSGLMYLPLALSDVLSATLTGASLKYLGYPNPYMILGTVLMSVATGLFSTFTMTTNHNLWIPFQVLQGLGVGMTLSMPYVATQTALKPEDIAVGTAMLQSFQFFGASVWLAAGESIFENKLVAQLSAAMFSQKEIEEILSAGSAEVRSVVQEAQLSDVLDAFNYALTKTFYVAASVAALSFFLSLGMRWKSVKPPKPKVSSADVEAKM
ncbi:Major facilitator superfamily domain general substrate transporter [Penicillium argentinense]|uniref:Major facilitator superfamily domain general substrate transporter n=1 Tax=Penicillium argentinense TaxID=1131581 RepID=A0A9W9EYJ3_9EURO|nr:Major facilitator superfamily domain general substrate transporter [Penicillium argentinense]KAJ5090236.1 Major facilitator superfamily domain general substrate transporter [Penicillium argentinense]